jgi:predicted PurR-regulated permease PerM
MFFFFADGPAMMDNLMELAPLDRDYERELLIEFDRVTRAVVVATLLSAVVQGLLAGIGYVVAGLDSVFLLMLLTGVFAMVPFFGAAAVWLPACLWLYFYEDRPVAAILLGIYGTAVVSMADNVIKPWVLHGQSKLHPLAALLSVLGGVQALGPIGILVGPMVFVFLATLLKILRRELTRMEKLPWSNVKKA